VRRIKFTFDDALLIAAIAALIYFKNWWASVFLLLVVVYLVVRYYQQRKREPKEEDNEFVIDKDIDSFSSVEIDLGLDYRPLANHFRINSQFDTSRSATVYEYRVDTGGGKPEVQLRLIDNQYEDVGVPRYHDVRDGVVMESDMRKRDEESKFRIIKIEDRIRELQKEVQWQKMESTWGSGLKYFIISKKLPQADARRYLRQEMERLKAGESAYLQEAEKLGLERDEMSKSLDRLKLSEGKPRPSDEDLRKLHESAETFGLTRVEFAWGAKLLGVLKKLLRD
jgi:Ca2+/Na+ antiporter